MRPNDDLLRDIIINFFFPIEQSPVDLLDYREGVDGLVTQDDYFFYEFLVRQGCAWLYGLSSAKLQDSFLFVVG